MFNELFFCILDILLALFVLLVFNLYMEIFFNHCKKGKIVKFAYIIYCIWQLPVSGGYFHAYVNISITIVLTLILSNLTYQGKAWNISIFCLAFNAIWMLVEILCGYFLMNYFDNYMTPQHLGSLLSKIILLLIVIALRKVFFTKDIRELPLGYSVMLLLIPLGSIYIMNNIFVLSSNTKIEDVISRTSVTLIIIFCINILIFLIYIKLADELQLKRCNAVYEKQLDLCERHQQQMQLSMLELRNVKHNIKNDLILILAYAEKGKCANIIELIEGIIEDSGINQSFAANTGNIVTDSLVNYWSTVADKLKIKFLTELQIPIQMPYKGADLGLIIGNSLENAVEAAGKVESGEKYVKLHMKYEKASLFLSILNSYNGKVDKNKDGKYRTTKADTQNHGIGLTVIKKTVDKYNGTMVIDNSDNEFLVKILLYDNGNHANNNR